MTHPDPYDGCTVGHLFRGAIERGGERIAFVDDGTVLTFRQFGERLSGIVQALEARGLARGTALATLSDNRVDAYLVTAAANTMGVRSTAMHPLGSADDHAYILSDSGIGTRVFDTAAHAERARLLTERTPGLRLLALGASELAPDPHADAAAELIALVREAKGPVQAPKSVDSVASLPLTGLGKLDMKAMRAACWRGARGRLSDGPDHDQALVANPAPPPHPPEALKKP